MTSTLPKVIPCVIVIDRLAVAGRLELEAAHEGMVELGGHLVHCNPDLSAGQHSPSSLSLPQPHPRAPP